MLLLDHHHLHRAALWFSKWYKTKIVGLYLGDAPAIVLNDFESVRKALYNREMDGKGDPLMGRHRHPDFKIFGGF